MCAWSKTKCHECTFEQKEDQEAVEIGFTEHIQVCNNLICSMSDLLQKKYTKTNTLDFLHPVSMANAEIACNHGLKYNGHVDSNSK